MSSAKQRLLVVRLGSLGDLVHALPAVAALRRAFPDADIDWLVDRVHRPFLELVPVISTIIELERPSVGGWLAVRRRLQARQYAIAVDFQGLIKSAVLARLSKAGRVFGFDRASAREPLAARFYTVPVPVGETGHVIDKNLRLAAAAGAPDGTHEFPLAVPASRALDEIRSAIGGPFAVLNCGAAWPNKRWPPERFGRLAAWLASAKGLRSVVMWGPGEQEIAQAVVAHSVGAAISAPASGLGDLVAILREARLMVSGDTGPTHIAGAVGTPIVSLFGPTSAARNGPWHSDDVTLSRYESCACHYQRRCRYGTGEPWCLGTIAADEVERAIDARLRVVR